MAHDLILIGGGFALGKSESWTNGTNDTVTPDPVRTLRRRLSTFRLSIDPLAAPADLKSADGMHDTLWLPALECTSHAIGLYIIRYKNVHNPNRIPATRTNWGSCHH